VLRVKDFDLERREITVRSGKGRKDHRTMVPSQLLLALRDQLASARAVHQRDGERGIRDSSVATTFARCRSFSATEMSPPLRSTRTSSLGPSGAQMKPTSSRATAVMTLPAGFVFPVSRW
jgi:integrase